MDFRSVRNKYLAFNTTSGMVIVGLLGLFLFLGQGFAYQETNINDLDYSDTINSNYIAWDKDLSELGQRISTRLKWVLGELFWLIGKKALGSISLNTTASNDSTTSQLSNNDQQNYFQDIQDSPYKDYINVLAEKGIIKWCGNSKFYPENFTRLGDFLKVTIDIYRLKKWYDINSNEWLTSKEYFSWMKLWNLNKYINTAYQLWLLYWMDGIKDQSIEFEQFNTADNINQILTNVSAKFPSIIQFKPLISENEIIRRWECAKHMVQVFGLIWSNNNVLLDNKIGIQFTDISGNPNEDEIALLGGLGITNTINDQFYPNDYLKRHDFVVMLVNAYLYSKWLDASQLPIYDNSILDVDNDVDYSPFMEFAENNWRLDYLFVSQKSQNQINPDWNIKKDEVYHVLSQVNNVKILYEDKNSDQYMTRSDFAKALVAVFEITENNTQGTGWIDTQTLYSLLWNLKNLLANI